MKQGTFIVAVALTLASCVTENNYNFFGVMPDAETGPGDAETQSQDGTGDVGLDVPCETQCEGRVCGPDKCGGSCGTCDDGNPCTTDSCDAKEGKCEFVPVEQDGMEPGCDDSNPCTTDSCDPADGQCDFVAVEDADEPACDDGNPCTTDLCTSGACDNPLFPLEDLVDEVAGGQCLCKTDEDCADLNDADLCNGVLHCAEAAEGEVPAGTLVCQVDPATIKDGTYDDGQWCNGIETCEPATGEMVAGAPPALGDGIDCTLDTCDEDNDKALHVADDAACDDGKFCNGSEICDQVEGCIAGVPPSVDDSVVCTVDACDEDSDSVLHTPSHEVCDDNDKCTGVETCDPTQGCLPGTSLTCDDQNACSANQCDPKTGCEYPSISCDDKNLCTNDGCDGLTGCFHTPVICDDGVECTTSTCDPVKGCLHTPVDALCDDAKWCTMESCDAAVRCVFVPDHLYCDDGNPCTEDTCVPWSGCKHSVAALDATKCEDGDPCTKNDVCTGGTCKPGPFDEAKCLSPGFVKVNMGSFRMGSPGGEPCPVRYTGGGC